MRWYICIGGKCGTDCAKPYICAADIAIRPYTECTKCKARKSIVLKTGVNCPKCGKEIGDWVFCNKCGTNINEYLSSEAAKAAEANRIIISANSDDMTSIFSFKFLVLFMLSCNNKLLVN